MKTCTQAPTPLSWISALQMPSVTMIRSDQILNLICAFTSPDDIKLNKSSIRDATNRSNALRTPTQTALLRSHREQSQFEEEEYPICCSRPRRTQQPISAPRTPLCSRCSFSSGQQTRSAGNPQNNSARTLRDRATGKKVDLIGN